MGLQVLIKAPILAVWAILKIVGRNWQLSLVTATAVLILMIFVVVCIVLALPKFKKLQVLVDNLNRVSRESLSGISVTRAYNAEKYQENKFEKANEELTSVNLFTNRTLATLMPTITLIMSGVSLAIYWVGAILLQNSNMMGRMELFSDIIAANIPHFSSKL